MSSVPLRRNRDFVLYTAGRLLSSAGTQLSIIAYPLLVLAVTHSASKAGLVAFARGVPGALFALPAGLAADHFGRKGLMIVSDAARAGAVGALAVLIVVHHAAFWTIPPLAFVEGCGAAIFSAASVGAVRAVVPPQQLPAAIASNTARLATVQVLGPPLGGLLYGLGRFVPFLGDALSYAFSTGSILAMRTPFQEERERDESPLRTRLADGFRFLWSQPFLRTSTLVFGLLNFFGPAWIFAVVVLGRRHGLSSGAVGALVTVSGLSIVAGSALSPFVRRKLPSHAVLLLELWAWCASAFYLAWPSVYVLAALLVPSGLAIPSTDSVVHSLRIGLTPDRLIGRVSSVHSTISLAISPLGPLIVGFLIADASPRSAVGVLAGLAIALALWGTLSPAIRSAPSLADLLDR